MFVAPSAVYFTTCPDVPNLECLTSDAELEELSKKILINSEGLRLQVVNIDTELRKCIFSCSLFLMTFYL